MAEKNNVNAQNTYDRGVVESTVGFYKTLFHLHDAKAMSCLPAIVESYDKEAHIVEVKPLVQFVKRGIDKELPFDRPIYKVPVHFISQGGFAIEFPLFRGDTGMLFAVDREWETAREKNATPLTEPQEDINKDSEGNKGAQPPDSLGYANFEYGFFLPMSFSRSSDKEGEGISIERRETDDTTADIIRLTKDGLFYEGENGEELEVVLAVRYNSATNTIDKKVVKAVRFGNFFAKVSDEPTWKPVPYTEGDEEEFGAAHFGGVTIDKEIVTDVKWNQDTLTLDVTYETLKIRNGSIFKIDNIRKHSIETVPISEIT